eukprot:TRINITY_DN49376_c0_g1_i1.p1 TRINITY_DN49376_c0_g1~~TRINITY_DN49376_c0_g1_i1.p1  ORF type:complete len:264 (+),score=52.86 TRINITY_DN49376_c0_g1_i1:229-1020(+)
MGVCTSCSAQGEDQHKDRLDPPIPVRFALANGWSCTLGIRPHEPSSEWKQTQLLPAMLAAGEAERRCGADLLIPEFQNKPIGEKETLVDHGVRPDGLVTVRVNHEAMAWRSHSFGRLTEKTFGGDMERWAVVAIQRKFRRRRAVRVLAFLASVKSAVSGLSWPGKTYNKLMAACSQPWADGATPSSGQASALALEVTRMLNLPSRVASSQIFDQDDYIRSWDRYTFMQWLIPQILGHLDESMGRLLHEVVLREQMSARMRRPR